MSSTGEPTWQDLTQVLANEMDRVAKLLRNTTPLFDPVTGLVSGAYLELRLHEEVSRAERLSIPFSLVALSVVGHTGSTASISGDLLRQTGQLLQSVLRGMDVLAAAHKLEFLVLLPEAGAEEAALVANRLMNVVAAAGNEIEGLRIAAGTASYPENGGEPDTLLAAARLALLRVRSTGVARRGPTTKPVSRTVVPEDPAPTAADVPVTTARADQAAGLRNAAAWAEHKQQNVRPADTAEVPVAVGFAAGGHFPVSFWENGNLITVETVLEEHAGEDATHLMVQTTQGVVRLTRRGQRWYMGAWLGYADQARVRGA